MSYNPPQFTQDGIVIQNFADVFAELVAKYQAIYGSSIDLDQNTPDGQKLGIEAKLSADVQAFALALYNGFDPDFALGNDLIRIAKICGINKKPSTPSVVGMEIVTDQDLTLPAGFTVQDTQMQNWYTLSDQAMLTGSNSVTMYAQNWGLQEALADTITNIITIVLGVVSATNPLDAVAGQNEETDEQFRLRRNMSLRNPSYSTTGGLYAKLANLAGVTDLQVYENDQDTYDPDYDLVGHSLWIVIQGGDNEQIAQTTSVNKTGGTGLKGSTTGTWIETFRRPDGTTFEVIHNIKFDRPLVTDLFIRLTVARKYPSQAIDTALIKQKVAKKTYQIGQDAQANELYSYVYQAGTNFIATALEISIDNMTWTDGDIEAGYGEVLYIDQANITITGS
jgi:uncharacterized phage protein gp47/JayE